jgi:hypothetical protein
MKVDCAFLIVVKFAFWVLVIGILSVLPNNVQAFPIEPVIVAGATACCRSHRTHERRLTTCRPMRSSQSSWNGCRSCSTDAATVRAPTTEPGLYYQPSGFTIPAM